MLKVALSSEAKNTFNFYLATRFLAERSVHVILAPEDRVTEQSIEIVLGGDNNRGAWISRGGNRILKANIDMILSPHSFKPFWISWKGGNIQVGTGGTPNLKTQFMFAQLSGGATSGLRYVGFATGDGATGEFRLWQKEGENLMFFT